MIARRILIGITLALTVVAWGRLLQVARRPSPARHLQFFGLKGPMPEDALYTHQPLAADGDREWILGDDWESNAMIVRVDFAHRRADVMWPLPKNSYPILDAAQNASGDLAICVGSYDSKVYRLRAAGGVEPLGELKDRGFVVGLAWTGDALEIARAERSVTRIYRVAGGQWTSREVAPPPDARKFLHVRAERATFANGAWHFVFSRSIADGDDSAALELVEDANVIARGRIALREDVDHVELASMHLQYTYVKGHGLWWIGRDRARESGDMVMHPSLAPGVAMSWSRPNRAYVLARGDQLGPVLTRDRFIDESSAVVPSSDGGFWVLGAFGRHLKAGPDLKRSDAMGFAARYANLFREFREYGRWWERASVPFITLFLPLVVAVGWRRRWLAAALVPCLIVTALLAKPFFEMTAIF
jgi:hypothetical protein